MEETVDVKVQHKLFNLGVDPWPLPLPSAVLSHNELIGNLTRLVELEHKLRLATEAAQRQTAI